MTASPTRTAHIDWRRYFAGRWRMTRLIEDRRDARSGMATGVAAFGGEEGGDGLVCSESLVIDYGGRRFAGEQRMIWRFDDARGPALHFHDGRFFCAMQFREVRGAFRAGVAHLCGEDRYEGEATIANENEWGLVWNVAGPRKDYSLDTRFSRLADENVKQRACQE